MLLNLFFNLKLFFNIKNIGTLYLIFGGLFGVIGTLLILIRIEFYFLDVLEWFCWRNITTTLMVLPVFSKSLNINFYSSLKKRRYFSSLSSSHLQPAALPNINLYGLLFQLFLGVFITIAFSADWLDYLAGFLIMALFFVILYNFLFDNERIMLFINEFKKVFVAKNTIITKIMLSYIGFWVLVLHIFFYTRWGYIFWSSSVFTGVVAAGRAIISESSFSIGPGLLLLIGSLGVTSVSLCHYIFYREKFSPFLYKYINKSILLLLVENPGRAAWYLVQRLAGPAVMGTAATAIYSAHQVVVKVHLQQTLGTMYNNQATLNAQQGLPAPNPANYTIQGVNVALAKQTVSSAAQAITK